jgi:hypothetical protein
MPPNEIVLTFGLMLVVFGALAWAVALRAPTRHPRSETNSIRFVGFDVTLNTPAFGVMAFGVVLVLASFLAPTSWTSEEQRESGQATSEASRPRATPAGTVYKIYKVCSGEHEDACVPHDYFLYCNANLEDWALTKCVTHTTTRIDAYPGDPGDKCGYALDEVACGNPL